MISVAIKKLQDTGHFLVGRDAGAIGGKIRPISFHYAMRFNYTIHLENGSANTSVETVFPGGEYTALSTSPTWEHHRFLGWFTEANTPSTSTATAGINKTETDTVVWDFKDIYANWQIPSIVTFDATTNGGQMSSGWTAPDYYISEPFGILPNAEKSGQTFIGWYDSNGNRVNETTTVTASNLYLKARYLTINYATTCEVTTTSSYKDSGIYSATRYSSSEPIVVDWGDGKIDVIEGNISGLTHVYDSVGTFTVKISDNIVTFAPSSLLFVKNQYTLKKVLTLSNKITTLDAYAYYCCEALTDVIVPNGIQTIPNNCFHSCRYLKPFTIPSSVTTIGSYAFSYIGGSQFNSITIPGTVTSIGESAFDTSNYLRPVFAPGSANLTLGYRAFANTCYYHSDGDFILDLSPRKITTIPRNCFQNCRCVSSIVWPQNLSSIDMFAFGSCFSLIFQPGTVEIPEGVTTIGANAFQYCTALYEITLPTTLANLGNYTFRNCERLGTIKCNRMTAPTVTSTTFGNTWQTYTGSFTHSSGTNKLIVPQGATGYTSSYWSSVLLNSSKCGFTLETV